jgi:hypothetical protein
MKFSTLFYSTSLCALLFLCACAKKEEPAPLPAATSLERQTSVVKSAADTAVNEAGKAGTTATVPEPPAPEATATPLPPETPAAAQAAEGETAPSAQAIIDRVRTLVAEKKYPEAVTAFSQLSKVNLTAEQQTIVRELKTQISNGMAAEAGSEGLKSVGGLLNRKK